MSAGATIVHAHFAFLAGTAAIVFARHSANIRRLVAGREPRLGAKSAAP